MCHTSVTGTLILTIFTTCFGSSLLVGYNIGVVNLPAPFIKDFLRETILANASTNFHKRFITPTFLYAQVSTIFILTAAIGSFSSGFFAEHVGRRNSLLANSLIAIAGAIVSDLCLYFRLPHLLFIGRAISGFSSGLSLGIASLYLVEVSPRRFQGMIGGSVQLAITLGILLSYLVTLSLIMNTRQLWPHAIGLSAVPAAFSLIVLPCCPESPRFLLARRDNCEAAQRAFKRFNKNAEEEMDVYFYELSQDIVASRDSTSFKTSRLFTDKKLRLAILIAVLMQVFAQLSGINAVITYSSTMLATAGVPSGSIQYYVLLIGIVNFLVTIVALPLLDKLGRRTILLWPSLLLGLSLLVLTVTVTIEGHHDQRGLAPDLARQLSIVSVVFIFIYIICFASSLGPLPCLIVPELFRQEPRASANALSLGVQWLCNLLVVFSYPVINERIGGLSFLPFLCVVVLCWIFFFVFMPETKNRSFDDIAEELEECKTWCASRHDKSSNESME